MAAGAALAGVLRASRSISATPSDDLSFVFSVIAAIVVGGTSIAGGEGTVWRTILGAFFIGLMSNGFNLHQVDPIYQRIVQGLDDYESEAPATSWRAMSLKRCPRSTKFTNMS